MQHASTALLCTQLHHLDYDRIAHFELVVVMLLDIEDMPRLNRIIMSAVANR